MITKTDNVSVDQYKVAYKKYIEKETHTIDFDDARVEIQADRIKFLMNESMEILKQLIGLVQKKPDVSMATQAKEMPTAQNNNDSVEEKRSFSPR